jgi:hypothetical protein
MHLSDRLGRLFVRDPIGECVNGKTAALRPNSVAGQRFRLDCPLYAGIISVSVFVPLNEKKRDPERDPTGRHYAGWCARSGASAI